MTSDLLLMDLYRVPGNPQALAKAAKYAPSLLFDEREPFLPLAAGYTLIDQDGPSPSFPRNIQLAPPGKEPAALAIEYAVWWDWDIHHLYELEHVWIYLDEMGRPLRIEGSLHGGYHELPLLLEGTHPVLLSAPGKHGFASVSSWFRRRARATRRAPTRFPGLHARVLVEPMFAGEIQARISDQLLVRSYLTRQAFDPAWKFSKRFMFQPSQLVPWPALRSWIPRRVAALLHRLENAFGPADYIPLRLDAFDGTLPGLQAAARAGADVVFLPLHVFNGRLEATQAAGQPLDIQTAYAFCASEPMRMLLEPAGPETVERLCETVRSRRKRQLTLLTSPEPAWLARYGQLVPEGQTAIQLTDPEQDPLPAAEAAGAAYIHLRWEQLENPSSHLTPAWVARVHQAGLGLISWPAASQDEYDRLRRLGIDIVWRGSALAATE